MKTRCANDTAALPFLLTSCAAGGQRLRDRFTGTCKAISRNHSNVALRRRRYVRKPNGARPGMVIYTTYRTMYVKPMEAHEK